VDAARASIDGDLILAPGKEGDQRKNKQQNPFHIISFNSLCFIVAGTYNA